MLVYGDDFGMAVSWWYYGREQYGDAARQGWFTPERDNRDEPLILSPGPTHWMPLPPPPIHVEPHGGMAHPRGGGFNI